MLHHLEMEVRPGGISRGADPGDDLSPLHIVSHGDQVAGVMGIEGGKAVAVVNAEHDPIRASPAGHNHNAAFRSHNGCSHGGGNINSLMKRCCPEIG